MSAYLSKSPLVSVIIAAYNCEDTLGYAIKSVLLQSFHDFEVIVVDDASKDGTAQILEKLSDDDPRIRILRHSMNRGPAAARNTALEVAQGVWGTVLDADDAWHPERLEVLVQYSKSHSNAFFADDNMLCLEATAGTLVPWKSLFQSRGLLLKHELTLTNLPMLVKHGVDVKPFYPLETIRRFAIRQLEGVFGGESLDFNAQLIHAGLSLYLIKRPLYYYRVSGNHLSSKYESLRDEIMVCQRLFKMEWTDEPTREALKKHWKLIELRLPWSALRQGLYQQAARDLWHSPGSTLFIFRRTPELFWRLVVKLGNRLRAI